MSMEEKREKLEKQVEDSRKDIRADRMDMSFGEIMNILLVLSKYEKKMNNVCMLKN